MIVLNKIAWIPIFLMSFSICAKGNSKWLLSQHSIDKNKTSKPAMLQYTNPDEGKSSYNIDGALSYLHTPDKTPNDMTLEYGFSIEGHKNTLTDKLQDTLAVKAHGFMQLLEGGCVSTTAVIDGVTHTVPGVEVCTNALWGSVALGHQTDNEKNTESIQLINEYTGVFKDLNINVPPSEGTYWFWSPTIGLEYEDFIKAPDNKKGDLMRIFARIDATLVPLPKDFDALSFSFSFANWKDFNKDSSLDIADDSHSLKQFSMSYRLTPKDYPLEVSLEYTWFDGENPREKKIEQKYSQIGFGFSYTLK